MDKDYQQVWAMGGVDVVGETALWQSVIMQAALDAKSMSETEDRQWCKHYAIVWLTGMSKDFILVCELARMCPIEICQSAKRWLSQIMGQNEGKSGTMTKANQLRP